MKRIIIIILFVITLYDIYINSIINNIDIDLLYNNIIDIDILNNNIKIDNLNENIYLMGGNEHASKILNCLYISRYMGQDWNKRYFYVDNVDDLTEYCKNLIKYIEDTLYEQHKDIKGADPERIKKYFYKRYINEFILHARECIDLTGSNDINRCNEIENLIEKQTDIKKNMCLNNVDDDLCNKYKIDNNTPIINGYTDRNMTTFGRDFYSKERNYYIHKMPKLNIENETNTFTTTTIITSTVITIIGVCYIIYNNYK